jgi:hypothetical protein
MARLRKTARTVVQFGSGDWRIDDFGEMASPRFALMSKDGIAAKGDNPLLLEQKYMEKIYGKTKCREIKQYQKENV